MKIAKPPLPPVCGLVHIHADIGLHPRRLSSAWVFFNDHLGQVHAINFTPDCVFICHPDRGHASYEDAQRARHLKDSLLKPWDDFSVDHALC